MSVAAGLIGQLREAPPTPLSVQRSASMLLVIAVDSTTPANGSSVVAPLTSLTVHFNEAFDPATINTSNLVLSQGTVSGFTIVDTQTVTYDITGVDRGWPVANLHAGRHCRRHRHRHVRQRGGPLFRKPHSDQCSGRVPGIDPRAAAWVPDLYELRHRCDHIGQRRRLLAPHRRRTNDLGAGHARYWAATTNHSEWGRHCYFGRRNRGW